MESVSKPTRCDDKTSGRALNYSTGSDSDRIQHPPRIWSKESANLQKELRLLRSFARNGIRELAAVATAPGTVIERLLRGRALLRSSSEPDSLCCHLAVLICVEATLRRRGTASPHCEAAEPQASGADARHYQPFGPLSHISTDNVRCEVILSKDVGFIEYDASTS